MYSLLRIAGITLITLTLIAGAAYHVYQRDRDARQKVVLAARDEQPREAYWFILKRTSNIEELYYGIPGDIARSELRRTFTVKVGRPGERPTPLPKLVGREYWRIVREDVVADNPETAPYFLALDVPAPSEPPYGPAPYLECGGAQCDWVTFGEFGLHGVNGDMERLSPDNPGSSGCIRHSDDDITYLYDLLEPEKGEIRYYVEET
jgi:hypothetical protein